MHYFIGNLRPIRAKGARPFMSELDFPIPKGYAWQYHFIVWVQQFQGPVLTHVAKLLSIIGMDRFYMIVLPVLYWSFNRKIGLRLIYVFMASMFVNVWLKAATEVIRPIGVPGIQSHFVSSAIGYAMPSGHAQGAMTFWTMMGLWLRKTWFWCLALLVIFGIGASRVYLGLHWPLDVVVGWGIGLLFAVFGWGIGQWWSYRKFDFGVRMTFAVLLPGLLLWQHNDLTSALYAALLLGLGVGALLEERWLGLDIDGLWWKRLSAALIGIAGMIAVQWLTKALGNTSLPLTETGLVVLRGVLLGLWGTLGAPYVFGKSGLYRVKEAA